MAVTAVAAAFTTGVSSVMVSCSSLADRVTALPSKSTACTSAERSNVWGPLWSIGARSWTLHEPSALSVRSKTWVPLAEPPVKASSSVLPPAILTTAKSTAAPCDVMPTSPSTVLALLTNWNGAAFAPSAPKCTSVSSEPATPPEVVADAGSLPVPNGSLAPRPPSLTVAATLAATVTGESSVMVTCSSLAASVTALPSKSTACTRPDRSMVVGALWSIGSSSANVHEPSLLRVSVKTWSLLVSIAVRVLVAVSTLAVVTWNPCDVRPRPATTLLALVTNWNGVALAPSAPKCTSASSEPTVPVKVVADAGSLPLP